MTIKSLNISQEEIYARTRSAFIWTRIASVPFWALINLLSIILYKEMHISAFQVTAIITLKPMSALLAPYWSQMIYHRHDRVISNLVWANILRYLPFLFIPWLGSPWMIILAFGIYMMLFRGVIPAWMETLKCHLPEESRDRLVAYGSTIDYCGTALLPLVLGFVLDGYEQAWKWLFPATALLGLVSTWFLYRIPELPADIHHSVPQAVPDSFLKEQILKPWKHSWKLIKENSGFAQFQIGFMLGGAGLMVMQPALPAFFVDVLNLSYTKMLLALSVSKGIGFAMTSALWIKLFRRLDIYYFSGLVTILAGLFPLVLLGAQTNIILLYLAYGLYGVMQAGSELGWHMSGPVFSQEKDSSPYSGTNVLTVGLRGCIAPSMGALIFSLTNSAIAMFAGAILCFLATQHLMRYSRRQQRVID